MYYKLIKYINGFIYILKPKFENNRQIIYETKKFFDLYFSNQSRFNLKSINGI